MTTLLPELRAYGRSISGNRADAEDLVSAAIECAALSPAKPKGLQALRRWLFRIIWNLNIDESRKRRVRREYSAAQEPLVRDWAVSGANCEDAVALRMALAKLGRREREVIVLIDVTGFRYAEAAALMDVPVGTVMSRISRARRALLRLLEPDAADAPGGQGSDPCA